MVGMPKRSNPVATSLGWAMHTCIPAFSWRSYQASITSGGTSVVDRKSTRLNSSHLVISYAVFCLKKKHPDPRALGGRSSARGRQGVSGGGTSVALTSCVFFFNDTATTEIYTLSLHDALPISITSGGTSV